MVQQRLSGRDYDFREPILRREQTVRSKGFSVENSKGNRESLNRQNQQMTLKPVPTSGRFKMIFFCRHHNEPRVQLCVLKEETFPVPLKHIDVTGSTYIDLDVM